jgi:integrase
MPGRRERCQAQRHGSRRQSLDQARRGGIGGKTRLAQLTPARIESFRDDLLANLSRPMARKVLTSLKSLLKAPKHAHVAAGVSIGRNKRGERKLEVGREIPTPGEIKRLIEAAKDGKQRALLLTAALTGMRASELRGLRWADVDLRAGEIHVRQRADRYCKIGAPKSTSSVRSIPLAPDVLAALKQWKLACPKGEAGLAFPTSTGQIEHHSNMLRSLAPVMKVAGVVDKNGEPKYGLHALRHFFASWCMGPTSGTTAASAFPFIFFAWPRFAVLPFKWITGRSVAPLATSTCCLAAANNSHRNLRASSARASWISSLATLFWFGRTTTDLFMLLVVVCPRRRG